MGGSLGFALEGRWGWILLLGVFRLAFGVAKPKDPIRIPLECGVDHRRGQLFCGLHLTMGGMVGGKTLPKQAGGGRDSFRHHRIFDPGFPRLDHPSPKLRI